jgi:predicted house-cleaning noncanonical NTP pyrophosphatase (MazG superfamily)
LRRSQGILEGIAEILEAENQILEEIAEILEAIAEILEEIAEILETSLLKVSYIAAKRSEKQCSSSRQQRMIAVGCSCASATRAI